MATSSGYDDESLISKGLYRIVSDVVGPECIVKLRRQRHEISDTLVNCSSSRGSLVMISGSRAEGFEFESSDVDMMFVDTNAIVLSDPTLLTVTYSNIPSLYIMETDSTAPGFAFLKCLKFNIANKKMKNTLELRGSDIYVSSKQIRETFMSVSISSCHGPCQTSTQFGVTGDHAYTLNCPTWPKQAVQFIIRSLDRGWPSYHVLTDICKDGCLLVPINSKQQQCIDMIDLEWRISFSLAEKKLVYTMNHCQFLCYGLFKVFLNEVIKTKLRDKDILCSYFMKTDVFWEISDNSTEWTPFNFLQKFWNVFRRLIKWVSIGYCPNFFIPENNMFYGKIFGRNQTALLGTLRVLYSEGYYSLLRCSSLNQNLSKIISRPQIADLLSFNEKQYMSMSSIEDERVFAICPSHYYYKNDTDKILKTLQNILMLKPETLEMLFAVRLWLNHVLQQYAEHLLLSSYSGWPTYHRNKKQNKDRIKALRILSRTKTFYCMNYLILIKHMYMAGNYQRTIEIIHYVKHKLQSQPYVYIWKNLNTNIIMASLQQGMSYDTLIKSYIVSFFDMCYLNSLEELSIECIATAKTNGKGLQFIPPLVFLNFLLILSYTRLSENHRRVDVLDELQTLVHDDNGYHILHIHKAISWEILGICQQICGNRHGALQSYIHALYHGRY